MAKTTTKNQKRQYIRRKFIEVFSNEEFARNYEIYKLSKLLNPDGKKTYSYTQLGKMQTPPISKQRIERIIKMFGIKHAPRLKGGDIS